MSRPIPQDVRPAFRDAPAPVQDMPAPFYGAVQPTLRDVRPGSSPQAYGRPRPVSPAPAEPAGPYPDGPRPYVSGLRPHSGAPAGGPEAPGGWGSSADPASTLAGPPARPTETELPRRRPTPSDQPGTASRPQPPAARPTWDAPAAAWQQRAPEPPAARRAGVSPESPRPADLGSPRLADPGTARLADPGSAHLADPGSPRLADAGSSRLADAGSPRSADLDSPRPADLGSQRPADPGGQRPADLGDTWAGPADAWAGRRRRADSLAEAETRPISAPRSHGAAAPVSGSPQSRAGLAASEMDPADTLAGASVGPDVRRGGLSDTVSVPAPVSGGAPAGTDGGDAADTAVHRVGWDADDADPADTLTGPASIPGETAADGQRARQDPADTLVTHRGAAEPEATVVHVAGSEPISGLPVIEGEVVSGPPLIDAAADEPGEEEHGLGWLLKMSGLGAVTEEPATAEPEPPAAPEPPVAVVEEPASEVRATWFEPNTDARLQRPASLADRTFPEEPSTEDPAARGSADATAAQEAAEPDLNDPGETHGADGDGHTDAEDDSARANLHSDTADHDATPPAGTTSRETTAADGAAAAREETGGPVREEAEAPEEEAAAHLRATTDEGAAVQEGAATRDDVADHHRAATGGGSTAHQGGAAEDGTATRHGAATDDAAAAHDGTATPESPAAHEGTAIRHETARGDGTAGRTGTAGGAGTAEDNGTAEGASTAGDDGTARDNGTARDDGTAEDAGNEAADGTAAGHREGEPPDRAAGEGEGDGPEAEQAVATDAGARLAAAVVGAVSPGVVAPVSPVAGVDAADPRSRLVDPEQVLSAYPFRFVPGTLREVADHPDQLRAVRDRLTDKLEYAERDAVRARLLSLRAVVSRVLGDLDFALADGRAALVHAERTGELRRTAIVQARVANVLRWRGDFDEADRLFEDANSPELPDRLRAEIAELAGRSAYEQGRYLEAMNRFEDALNLRRGQDAEMVTRVELALDAVSAKVRDEGWGPFPRTGDEIMGRPAPEPLTAGDTWAEVQAFAEGLAWARRPDDWAWELVDGQGRTVIDASAGYARVRPFSEGLAWVSREETGGWFAVDAGNRVVVPGGFDDALPFSGGVAPVRAGAWGAIDRYARPVVQPRYRRFVTVLAGGRRVDGFTREGLAVVDAGDRLGVVDRTGQLVVAPVHAALVIHPVAFLIADRRGRWGALDRDGEPLIEPVHRTEAAVTEAIDELLADTRPVL